MTEQEIHKFIFDKATSIAQDVVEKVKEKFLPLTLMQLKEKNTKESSHTIIKIWSFLISALILHQLKIMSNLTALDKERSKDKLFEMLRDIVDSDDK